MGIQAQDRYPHRTSIDQRGEQTFNRDAKVAGGIGDASDGNQVYKWALNRGAAAENLAFLRQLTGTASFPKPGYHEASNDQIRKSEENATAVYNVLENDYTNPFKPDINPKLVHLSSGVPIHAEASVSIFTLDSKGKKLYEEFRNSRLLDSSVDFHHVLKKNPCKGFGYVPQPTTAEKQKKKQTTAGVNRNILGILHSYSIRNPSRKVDYEKALEYPLSSIPLLLSNSDGSMRKTTKSELKQIIFKGMPSSSSIEENPFNSLIIDLIALFHQLTSLLPTLESVMKKVVDSICRIYTPNKVMRIDLVADNYTKDVSVINKGERSARGSSAALEMKSLKAKTPRDFRERILLNSANKTRIVELLIEYITTNKESVLKTLECTEINISAEGSCTHITDKATLTNEPLVSNQPEADTRVILHAVNALESPGYDVAISSPSGDTDILVLVASLPE